MKRESSSNLWSSSTFKYQSCNVGAKFCFQRNGMSILAAFNSHLEDELKHEIGDINLDNVSEDELEFYYFTVHDFDHNKLLDGLEIMAALQDSLEHYLGDAFSKEDKMKHYIAMTDEVLQEDDLDKDGFLTFVEYMHSQKRTASPTTILDKNAKDKTGSKKSD
ncbi:multiple coagulation factor deficiency protein 2 homolog isoform X2 [Xenopus laevis]|uniref:Multiple coagulation factor deficiency protein 2 homolog isoform X2 n=1 Tax=Xenopus laevis TaxID=8355 RepID=A0A8J1KMU7_XENLA|nr:multiple coagulation factor deficiency protein 2 homolog isoform X2 [Xenopus laevis]